ncbi:MAG: hypothetical protein QXQ81_10180 [Candidatus Thorarchaeota archaeon]
MDISRWFFEPVPIVLEHAAEIAVIGLVIWVIVFAVYDRGHLGRWPPSRRSVRRAIWFILLYPVPGFLLIGLCLVSIATIIQPLRPAVTLVIALMMVGRDTMSVLAGSLLYLVAMRRCWRGYGAAGVTVGASVTVSIAVILYSLDLTSASLGLGFMGAYGFWVSIWHFSSLVGVPIREPKAQRRRDDSELSLGSVEDSRREGAGDLKSVLRDVTDAYTPRIVQQYVIPLIRRFRIDRDESALSVLVGVLSAEEIPEEKRERACRALDFDHRELIEAGDTQRAAEVLERVSVSWGNISRTVLAVLLGIISVSLVTLLSVAWSYASESTPGRPMSFQLLIAVTMLFMSTLGLLSRAGPPRPCSSKCHHINKRHDEQYLFTDRELVRRRRLDIIVVIASLLGMTWVTLTALTQRALASDYPALQVLLMIYILSAILLRRDRFLWGEREPPEESVAKIRTKMLRTLSSMNESEILIDYW